VERILFRFVEQGFVKEKGRQFSLYLINTKYLEREMKNNKNKTLQVLDEDSAFESRFDSASMFPTILKQKLNH
jgi:hypothetical protein